MCKGSEAGKSWQVGGADREKPRGQLVEDRDQAEGHASEGVNSCSQASGLHSRSKRVGRRLAGFKIIASGLL